MYIIVMCYSIALAYREVVMSQCLSIDSRFMNVSVGKFRTSPQLSLPCFSGCLKQYITSCFLLLVGSVEIPSHSIVLSLMSIGSTSFLVIWLIREMGTCTS